MKRLYCLLSAGLLLGVSSVAQADSTTDRAHGLLTGGQGRAAFELLEPLESERAGDENYDFLLGLAALEIGQNTRAVFALERVLAVNPGNLRARAEIGRAYLALGEVETARQEFENVRKQGVPADVSLTLDRYIAAARRVEDRSKPSLNGFLEAQIGYDTNVNVGPNKNSVVIPGLSSTPAILSPDSKANRDAFGSLAGGVGGRLPLSENLALLAGVNGTTRANQHKEQFDIANYDANAGLVFTSGQHVATLMAQYGGVNVDDRKYRSVGGLTGQWQYNIDARNQFSTFVQYGKLNYEREKVRDADRWVAGAAYAYLWRNAAVLFGSLYGVGERADADIARYLGFNGLGIRLGGKANLSEKTTLFGGASFEYRRHLETDPSFLVTRTDQQYGLVAGTTYAFAREWTLTPQISLTANRSNTALNEYHRAIVSLAIRREF